VTAKYEGGMGERFGGLLGGRGGGGGGVGGKW
jgi:hypothetical protein